MNSDKPEIAPGEEDELVADSSGMAEELCESAEEAPLSEAEKWKEVALRTAADLENFRKRTAREREETLRYSKQELLEELLPVLDNFEMGMAAAEQDKGSMIYVGMDMVRKQLADFLANSGVSEVPAEGLPFDPNLHDAVAQEASDQAEEGTVLRVTRRGYMLRDRLLRPAGVVVATSAGEE